MLRPAILATTLLLCAATASADNFRKPAIQINVTSNFVADEETGQENLQMAVDLESLEHIFTHRDLTLTLIVIGNYDNNARPGTLRVLQNETRPFKLSPGETWSWQPDLIYSGRGHPNHINFGITYRGYVAAIQDQQGRVLLTRSTTRYLSQAFRHLKDVPANQDYQRR